MRAIASRSTRAAWSIAVSFALSACLDAASERALFDEGIGQGRVGDASFAVEGGLAAIRVLEPGRLTLWAKAPAIRVHATRGVNTPERWTFVVQNAMPDAVLEAMADGAEIPMAESLPRQNPTEQAWALALPRAAEITLSVHPARDEPVRPWRFAVLSDIQEAIDRVGDIYARMNLDPSIEFVVSAGDLTRRGSARELERFQQELERLRVPFFPTLGNHELGTENGEPFQRYYGRANFTFAYGGMQFTFLDSASATIEPLVYEWLDTWLSQGRTRTHAVLMHIPPIDPIGVRNGSFANRNEAAKLLAMLGAGGVDLTLYGHIHSFYSFSNAGIPAYISGGGGAIPERFDGVGRHYLTVDVDPKRGILQTGVVRIDAD